MAHHPSFPPPPHQRPHVPGYGTRNDELMSGSKTVFEFRGDAADRGQTAGGQHPTFIGTVADLDFSGEEGRESNLRSSGMTWVLFLFGGLVTAGVAGYLALRSPSQVEAALATEARADLANDPSPVARAAGETQPASVSETTAPPAPAGQPATAPSADGKPTAAPEATPSADPSAKPANAADSKLAAADTKPSSPTEVAAATGAETKPAAAREAPAPKPKPKPVKPKKAATPKKRTLNSSKAPRDGFGKLPPPPT